MTMETVPKAVRLTTSWGGAGVELCLLLEANCTVCPWHFVQDVFENCPVRSVKSSRRSEYSIDASNGMVWPR